MSAEPMAVHANRTRFAGRVARAVLLVLLASVALVTPPASASAAGAPVAQRPIAAPASPPVTWSIQPATRTKPDTRPTYTYQDFKPGSSRVDYAAVDNFSTKPLALSIYPTDAYNTSTGGFDVLTADQKPVDVGAWIQLAKKSVTVPARSSVIVPFTVTVPTNATPGFHVGGIMASSSTVQGTNGNRVRVDRRVGVRVFLEVSGPLHPVLQVKDLTVHFHGGWNPIHGGTASVSYTVANTGNVPLQAHQTLRATGLLGPGTGTTKPADLPLLLPGNSIKITRTLSDVWPGVRDQAHVSLAPYTSVVKLASVPTVEAKAGTWAVPWTWLIVLIVIVCLVAAWLVRKLVRRRRRTRAAAGAGASGSPAKAEAATRAASAAGDPTTDS